MPLSNYIAPIRFVLNACVVPVGDARDPKNSQRRCVRRRKMCALFSFAFILALPADAQRSRDVGGQVIRSEDLRAAGVTRLSNVLMLVDGARYATIDGFTIMPSFSGLAPVQDRLWSVEVDGLPIESGILDIQNLNALSVPVSSIDSIVVNTTPQVRMGRFRPGGTIEIFTRGTGVEEGYFARASLSAVNESGDPGPYRYADPDARYNNVDKEGPDASVEVGLKTGNSQLIAGGVLHQIIPSDPAVFARNYNSFDVPRTPEVRVVAPFLALSAQPFGARAVMRLSGASFDDMMYSRDIGREVPIRYERVGLAGNLASNNRDRVSWRTDWSWSTRQIRNDGRATRLPIDWREQSGAFATSATTDILGHRVTGGASLTYMDARNLIGVESAHRILTPRVFGLVVAQRKSFRYSADGFVGKDATGLAAGGSVQLDYSPLADHLLELALAGAQTLPSESNPMAFWAHHGVTLTNNSALTYSAAETESRLFSVDASWRWQPSPSTSVRLGSFGRRFAGLRYADRTIVAQDRGFNVAARDYQNAWGSTVGFNGYVANHSSFGDYSMTFDYQTVLAGNALFYDAYATIPRRQIRLDAIHRVGDRFSVKNSLFHYSSSYWDEFSEATTGSEYSASVDGFVRWDLAISKRLAKDRVHISAAVENILNDRVGFHPIGATFDRALRVQLTVAFD